MLCSGSMLHALATSRVCVIHLSPVTIITDSASYLWPSCFQTHNYHRLPGLHLPLLPLNCFWPLGKQLMNPCAEIIK